MRGMFVSMRNKGAHLKRNTPFPTTVVHAKFKDR